MPKTLQEIREAQRANARQYHQRMKDDPEYIEKKRANWRRWKDRQPKEKTPNE